MEIKGHGRGCPRGGSTKNHQKHQDKQNQPKPLKPARTNQRLLEKHGREYLLKIVGKLLKINGNGKGYPVKPVENRGKLKGTS
jgi:hypothetical protein